jgi:hypothetical protein
MTINENQALKALSEAQLALDARQKDIAKEPTAVDFLARLISAQACYQGLKAKGYAPLDIYTFAMKIVNGEL